MTGAPGVKCSAHTSPDIVSEAGCRLTPVLVIVVFQLCGNPSIVGMNLS